MKRAEVGDGVRRGTDRCCHVAHGRLTSCTMWPICRRANVVPALPVPNRSTRSDAPGATMTRRMHAPAQQGLYDPALRARRLRRRLRRRHARPPQPRDRAARPRRRSATSTTGAPPAPRTTSATAPASSSRCPTGFLREVVDFDLPAGRRLRRRHRLPARASDTDDGGRRRREDRRRRGPRRPRLARRARSTTR